MLGVVTVGAKVLSASAFVVGVTLWWSDAVTVGTWGDVIKLTAFGVTRMARRIVGANVARVSDPLGTVTLMAPAATVTVGANVASASALVVGVTRSGVVTVGAYFVAVSVAVVA